MSIKKKFYYGIDVIYEKLTCTLHLSTNPEYLLTSLYKGITQCNVVNDLFPI